jgi:DNA polymerase-3 subunit beta
VRQAALLTTEESRAVKLSFLENQLVITSQSPEQGDARIEIPIEYDGDALEIGFNPAFVSEALKVVPYDQLYIELHESFRPGILRGEDKEEFLYVIMPVSLSN